MSRYGWEHEWGARPGWHGGGAGYGAGRPRQRPASRGTYDAWMEEDPRPHFGHSYIENYGSYGDSPGAAFPERYDWGNGPRDRGRWFGIGQGGRAGRPERGGFRGYDAPFSPGPFARGYDRGYGYGGGRSGGRYDGWRRGW